MRHLPFRLSLVCLLGLPIALAAGEPGEKKPFQFGLESRFSQPTGFDRSGVNLGLIPNFTYHLNDRFRLDAFAGVAYSDEAGLYLSLQPGFRYYLGPPREKFRFNTGLSLGYTVIEQDYAPSDGAVEPLDPALRAQDDDGVWLRAVPIEVEYWGKKRWGLTMALDYQTRFDDDRDYGSGGFGLAAGLRFKIR